MMHFGLTVMLINFLWVYHCINWFMENHVILPLELEHKAYWVAKKLHYDFELTGEKL